eukprot:CAMPEP_0115089564 /NCGR_PEP_ID=MMETSP0227-20121206/24787_1 /TAXON_ID=89957 /ORGANISM="Polarella glacialis, Strain CCMP 1383" /LENGTH=49 /DNA_ID= /DNA_START= /DNA_END= /DNA_ORIENTATION=
MKASAHSKASKPPDGDRHTSNHRGEADKTNKDVGSVGRRKSVGHQNTQS